MHPFSEAQWSGINTDHPRAVVVYDIEFPTNANPSELFPDVSLEAWSSATNLTDWLEATSTGNTVNQETDRPHSGTYCARLTRTAAGNMNISKDGITGLEPPAR